MPPADTGIMPRHDRPRPPIVDDQARLLPALLAARLPLNETDFPQRLRSMSLRDVLFVDLDADLESPESAVSHPAEATRTPDDREVN